MNLPRAAIGPTIDGSPNQLAGPEGSTYLLAQTISVPQGQSRDVTVHFRLPGEHGQLQVVPAARVPSVSWNGQDSFTETSTHTVSW